MYRREEIEEALQVYDQLGRIPRPFVISAIQASSF